MPIWLYYIPRYNYTALSSTELKFNTMVWLVGLSGEKGRRIRELTSVVQKRFKFPENSVELYAEKVNNRGLCAIAQAESLRYKLLGGLAVRRYIKIIVIVFLMSF